MPYALPAMIFGGLFAATLAYFGVRLRYGRDYNLVAGYNTADRAEQEKYNIEGLADHLGNGLISLALLLLSATVGMLLESMTWCVGSMGLFVFVALIMVIGGRKFLPDASKPGDHRLLKWMVPESAFEAMRKGTQNWLLECSCGRLLDYWEAGGVRYKAVGNKRELHACEACGKVTWQSLRRKTDSEAKSVA